MAQVVGKSMLLTLETQKFGRCDMLIDANPKLLNFQHDHGPCPKLRANMSACPTGSSHLAKALRIFGCGIGRKARYTCVGFGSSPRGRGFEESYLLLPGLEIIPAATTIFFHLAMSQKQGSYPADSILKIKHQVGCQCFSHVQTLRLPPEPKVSK